MIFISELSQRERIWKVEKTGEIKCVRNVKRIIRMRIRNIRRTMHR